MSIFECNEAVSVSMSEMDSNLFTSSPGDIFSSSIDVSLLAIFTGGVGDILIVDT